MTKRRHRATGMTKPTTEIIPPSTVEISRAPKVMEGPGLVCSLLGKRYLFVKFIPTDAYTFIHY